MAAQRRKLPLGGVVPHDYTFEEWDATSNQARRVRLSELFVAGKDTLILYNFMFVAGKKGLPLEEGCPSCTSIIDAIDGAAPHLAEQINFAVVAKAPASTPVPRISPTAPRAPHRGAPPPRPR